MGASGFHGLGFHSFRVSGFAGLQGFRVSGLMLGLGFRALGFKVNRI